MLGILSRPLTFPLKQGVNSIGHSTGQNEQLDVNIQRSCVARGVHLHFIVEADNLYIT